MIRDTYISIVIHRVDHTEIDHGESLSHPVHIRSMSQSETEETIVDSKTFEYNVSSIDDAMLYCFASIPSVLFGLLVSYFLVTAGVIYDIIVEPPSVGQ